MKLEWHLTYYSHPSIMPSWFLNKKKKKRGIMPSLHDLQKMWQWQLQSRSQTLAWKQCYGFPLKLGISMQKAIVVIYYTCWCFASNNLKSYPWLTKFKRTKFNYKIGCSLNLEPHWIDKHYYIFLKSNRWIASSLCS